MVIEEEWFYDMNLTCSVTFTPALINYVKLRLNKNINFPRDTNQHIYNISIEMVGTHIFSRHFMRNMMVNFIFMKI